MPSGDLSRTDPRGCAPPLSEREHLVWLTRCWRDEGARRLATTSSMGRISPSEGPAFRDRCSDDGGACSPPRESPSTLCHPPPRHAEVGGLDVHIAGASQDPRFSATPRRGTTSGGSGCLGRFVSTCAGEKIALLHRPTDLDVTRAVEPLQSLEASAFSTIRSCPLLTGEARLRWLGRCPCSKSESGREEPPSSSGSDRSARRRPLRFESARGLMMIGRWCTQK